MTPDLPSARIWLRGYPVALGVSVAEHVEDWMREFALMGLAEDASPDVPWRLRAMVSMLSRRYATELSEPDRLRAAAAARGDAVVDLAFPVSPETEQVVRGWQEMLTEVDEFCRSRELLTLERTPEQVALNDWVLEQFLSQLRGEPAQPWPGALPPADGPAAPSR